MNFAATQKFEVTDEIDQFERNLQKFGIRKAGSSDEELLDGRNTLGMDTKKSMKFSSTLAVKSNLATTKKEVAAFNEVKRKERDKRRRKMIVDQGQDIKELELKKLEELIL